jgi:hypothetical protein
MNEAAATQAAMEATMKEVATMKAASEVANSQR